MALKYRVIFKNKKYIDLGILYATLKIKYCNRQFFTNIKSLENDLKTMSSQRRTGTISSPQRTMGTILLQQDRIFPIRKRPISSPKRTLQSIQSSLQPHIGPREPPQSQESPQIKSPKIGFLRSFFTGSKVTPLNQEMEPKTSAFKRFMNIFRRRNKVDPFNGIIGGLVKKIPKKKNMQKKKNQPTVVVGGLVKKIPQKKNVQKKKNQSSTVRGLVKKIPQKKNAKKNRNQG